MKTFLQRTISCLIIFVCLLACVSVKQVVNAEIVEGTATYTVTSSSAVSVSGTSPANSSVKYSSTYGTKCQLTSGNSMTLTLSGYDGYIITGITLSMKSNKSKGAGNLSVKAGSTTLSSIATANFNSSSWNGAWSTEYVDIKPAMSNSDYVIQSGETVTIIIAATANSLYCESFTIDYTKPQSEISIQEKFSALDTLSSLNLSWAVNESNSEQYFEKVTSTPIDYDANYLIVCEESKVAFDGSLTTLDAVSNNVPVNIENNKIAYDAKLDASIFTIDSNGYVKSKSGYYIGQTSDANGLKSSTTSPYTNTISFNNDGTVNLLSGGAYLRYNSDSGQYRFRYYKSSTYTGQKAISLYKFVGSSDEYSITNASVRFGATIEQELYEGLIAEGSSVEFGVAVAKVKDLGSTTLVDAYEANNSAVKSVSFTKEEVLANNYTFAVLVTNVPESFFAEDFVAACYVQIDGETYYMSDRQISFIEILNEYTQKEISEEFTQENKDLLTILYNAYK